ncbi:hypothetical protein NE674_05415 [Extibacter muris]|uniref:hypothetical protein n=1 Tax=Extibacter muris TaxID=1796622 RepID=UPI001D08F6D7|nr:hypothetical protein [Extibacter muris]MCB6200300.1 hypothetical protein [Extibacter muris]MCQ4663152.1 hypothetical protein [Extibacter muris]
MSKVAAGGEPGGICSPPAIYFTWQGRGRLCGVTGQRMAVAARRAGIRQGMLYHITSPA